MSKIQNFEVPSAVLHIRSIPTGTTENDLFQITFDQSHKFGKCISVRLLERYHQALLEMDSIESATRLLKYSQKNSLLLHGKPVQISYSKSQSINQTSNSSSPSLSSPPHSSTPSPSPSPSSSQSYHSNSHSSNNGHHHHHHRVNSPTYTTTNSSHHQQNVFPSSPSTRNHSFPSSSSSSSSVAPNKQNVTTTPPIPGSVLLCTIENPANHQITIDHLYHAFSSSGEVLRIVMFSKNNLQALIEFSSVENALNAKKILFGHSLFHGGQCTLKLEISKTDRLNVPHNTDRAKDYTKPASSSNPITASPSQHQPPQASYYRDNNNNNNNNSNGHHHRDHQSHHHFGQQRNVNEHHLSSYHSSHNNSHHHHHHSSHSNRTTVLIVHGLDENIMTIDRIFNLFSVYGNVQRIKVLANKKGAALVQMEDPQQTDLIIRFYHQMPLFKDTLQITHSKHLSITDSHNPESPTLSKTFTDLSLHRFSHPINTYKHLYKPSQTLYFSNVPKDFTETNFIQLLQSHNLPKPIGFKIFSAQLLGVTSPTTTSTTTTNTNATSTTTSTTGSTSSPSTSTTTTANNNTQPTANGTNTTTSSTSTTPDNKNIDKIVGLLEFQTQTQAVEALVILNNLVLPNSHYSLRLSFSNSTVLPHPPKVNNSNPNTPTTTTTTSTTSTSSPSQQQQQQQQQKHF